MKILSTMALPVLYSLSFVHFYLLQNIFSIKVGWGGGERQEAGSLPIPPMSTCLILLEMISEYLVKIFQPGSVESNCYFSHVLFMWIFGKSFSRMKLSTGVVFWSGNTWKLGNFHSQVIQDQTCLIFYFQRVKFSNLYLLTIDFLLQLLHCLSPLGSNCRCTYIWVECFLFP